jgi:hypothetical protein
MHAMTIGTTNNRTSFRDFASRAFVHGKMKSVCEEFRRPRPSSELLIDFWQTYFISNIADVKTVARNFIELQQERHAADYNLSRQLTRHDAEECFERAKEAMDAWKRLKQAHPDVALLFALCLMLWPGLNARQ